MRISPEPRISGSISGHLSENPEFGANPEILGPVGTLFQVECYYSRDTKFSQFFDKEDLSWKSLT